ncbi:MAG: pilus assembly protein PilM, partial [Planctomycetota bacterium]
MTTTAGIDIGSEAIKAVVLGNVKNGPVEIIACGTLALGELGHIEDSADKNLALGIKLKELIKTSRIKAQTRRVGASGKDTSIRYLQVPPVPAWRLDMLVKYEVEEKSGDKEPNTYDYRTLDVPDVGGQDTVLIGAIKEAAATELMARAKSAGLGEVEIDLEAIALFNAYYHGHGFDPDKTALVVDIGADDLIILICRNGSLFFARTLMGGGRRFSQALADELKIELLEAEEIKKTQAQISFDMAPGSGLTGRLTRDGVVARSGVRSGVRPGQPETNGQPDTTLSEQAGETPAVRENGRASTSDAP